MEVPLVEVPVLEAQRWQIMSVKKPKELVDRVAEWGTLERLWTSARPEMVFVVGRRRVGKSVLLSSFSEAVRGVYFQATRRTETDQLHALSMVLGQRFSDQSLLHGATLPTWEAAFDYLTQKAGKQPFLFVIDEFPYLSSASPPLTSILQKYWDHDWQKSKIKLVLAGSYITAMKQLEAHDQPLFGRRTAKLILKPFTYIDAAQFVPKWGRRERLMMYGLFGGLPGHLALIEPQEGFGKNVASLMLDPSGRLMDEAERLLDAFVPDAHIHYSILEAIANGDHAWGRLTGRLGKSGGSLLRPLQWLEEMGLVERVVPITERNPSKSKRVMYRLTDPYIEFWHARVSPLVRRGSIGIVDPIVLWNGIASTHLDNHMGSVFEQICRDFLLSKNSPFQPVHIGRWWDHHSENEIDLVAISSDRDVLVAECKWGKVDKAHLEKLRERSANMIKELGFAPRSMTYALFTGQEKFDRHVARLGEVPDVALINARQLLAR